MGVETAEAFMNFVREQKERERSLREREIPFGAFTLREKTRWWNEVELRNVFDALAWPKGGRLLDIGASDGRMLAFVRGRDRSASLTATDFALNPLKALRSALPEARAVCADAATSVFRPEVFDRITALQVIQQIPCASERQAAFRAAYAALKPGGRFVVTVLSRSSWAPLVANGKEGALLSSPELYVYLYDRDELRGELEAAGFSGIMVTAINNLPVRYLKRLGAFGVLADRLISRYFRRLSQEKGRYYCASCQKK
jgi:SAM-dependent methyltransferase